MLVAFIDTAVGENPTVRIGPGAVRVTRHGRRDPEGDQSKQDGPFGSSTKRFQRFSSFDTPGPGVHENRGAAGATASWAAAAAAAAGGMQWDFTASSLSSTSAAAAAAQRRPLVVEHWKITAGVGGPGSGGIMRGTLVRRAVTPDGPGAGSAAAKAPPRDPEDYDRSDPNTRPSPRLRRTRRDPSMVRRKRTEAGGGVMATASLRRPAGREHSRRTAPSTYSVLAQKSLQSGGSWSTKAGPDISRGGRALPDPKADTEAGPGSYQLPSAIQVPGKYSAFEESWIRPRRMVSHKPTTNVQVQGLMTSL